MAISRLRDRADHIHRAAWATIAVTKAAIGTSESQHELGLEVTASDGAGYASTLMFDASSSRHGAACQWG